MAMHRIRRLMYQVDDNFRQRTKRRRERTFVKQTFRFSFLFKCQGAFYRFQFLLLATIFCALMTMIWYFLSHVYETEWIWDSENRPKIHYSGAFVTGEKLYFDAIIKFSKTFFLIDRNLWNDEYLYICRPYSVFTHSFECR